ncbi:mycoredoxin [Smaragdicoccus niigatensis]
MQTVNKAVREPITMYSTAWCGYCRRLKIQLKAARIPFVEVDIEEDSASADFVRGINGGNHTVPTVKFPDGRTATNPTLAVVERMLAGR